MSPARRRVLGSRYYKRVPTRGATSQTIARAAIAVLLSATLVADQSAPASPPAAIAGYAAAWAVPVETSGPFLLAVGQHSVFVAHETAIAAYAKADGKLVWQHPRAGVTQLSASSSADAPLAAVSGTELVALDPGTGDVRWTAALAGPGERTYLAAFQAEG
jgi:outer membrane protein assembly factor BamB